MPKMRNTRHASRPTYCVVSESSRSNKDANVPAAADALELTLIDGDGDGDGDSGAADGDGTVVTVAACSRRADEADATASLPPATASRSPWRTADTDTLQPTSSTAVTKNTAAAGDMDGEAGGKGEGSRLGRVQFPAMTGGKEPVPRRGPSTRSQTLQAARARVASASDNVGLAVADLTMHVRQSFGHFSSLHGPFAYLADNEFIHRGYRMGYTGLQCLKR